MHERRTRRFKRWKKHWAQPQSAPLFPLQRPAVSIRTNPLGTHRGPSATQGFPPGSPPHHRHLRVLPRNCRVISRSWSKETNLKRIDGRACQNTQREKHATAQRQREHAHPAHARSSRFWGVARHGEPHTANQVTQAGPGDTSLFSEASGCLNCQLGTQLMMGVGGKAVSRQAHPARVCVSLPKGKRKKVELPLGLSWRVHLSHVLLLLWCFGFVGRLTDFLSFGDLSSSAFHSHWLTQLMVGGIRFIN